LESHVAFNDQVIYFTNASTDVFLDANASLHYCKAQKESLNAYHIGQTRVWQERDSNFDGFSLTAGSQLTRNSLNIALNGEGANAGLNALYSVFGNQHVDNHTSVDHRVPNCTSNQLYKGILNGDSRAVFNGKVFVRPIAQQTNSYQLNKNLLLGNNCRVDTKPQLEIFADDVKCTHGATIGQLDENEMFYLQTRCIPRNVATKMLVHGFVDDLFGLIKNSSTLQKVNALMQPSFEELL
jgi:Fe-S cluster assembly protein SufD